MTIVVTDFWPKKAHKYLNILIIKSLAKVSKVTVISVNGFYNDELDYFNENGITCINLTNKEREGRIGTRIYCMELQKKSAELIKEGRYNVMLCLSYETLALALYSSIIKLVPTILCQHSNLDDLQNGFKKLLARNMMLKTRHIVFEEEFKKWLISKTNISQTKVFVIEHPITMEQNGTSVNQEMKYECVGLCHANDDELIQEIVNNKKRYCDAGMVLVLRSSKVSSEGNELKIINRFLDRDEYRGYIEKAKCVLVATPPKYRYRISGSLFDAVALNKRVITTNKTLSSIYSAKYPGLCNYVNTEIEFFELLKEMVNNCVETDVFEEFKRKHSKNRLDCQVEQLVKELSREMEISNDYNTNAL